MDTEVEKHLTARELKAFFGTITEPRDRAMFTVTYWRGLRASEIGKLSVASFDQKTGRLKFSRLKGSRGGNDSLSPPELKALKAWLKVHPGLVKAEAKALGKDGKVDRSRIPMFPSNRGTGIARGMVFVLFRKYADAAGLPAHKRHPHCLKHSIASYLVEKNVELLKIQRWMGHKSINSTLVYAHLGQAEQDALAEKLYEDL